MATIHLTKDEFLKRVADIEANPNEWKFLGSRPALVDFFATWCGPCKALSPILEEVSKEYEGKVDIYKVDIDQEEELTARFNIRTVPSLLFIPMDGQPRMASGVVPKQQLVALIEENLLK